MRKLKFIHLAKVARRPVGILLKDNAQVRVLNWALLGLYIYIGFSNGLRL